MIKWSLGYRTLFAKILLETSAGQGNSIGVTIKQFTDIFNSFTKKEQTRLGVVIDTCHIYVAGYDISTITGITNYFLDFNKYVDIKNIKLDGLYHKNKKPWNIIDSDIIITCATQNEICQNNIKDILKSNNKYIIEASNMGWEDRQDLLTFLNKE